MTERLTESRIERYLGAQPWGFVRLVGKAADSLGSRAFLVGGVVRDCLLGVTGSRVDIDIMFTDDAIGLAAEMREKWHTFFRDYSPPSSFAEYKRYRTVKLLFDSKLCSGFERVDFSTARRETYASPAAKPDVLPGDLYSDMHRRDFSVNAMALSLRPGSLGEIVDYFSGAKDLARREINVLHDASFIDDPVRLLRGMRFAVRFGFSFGEKTEALFNEAAGGKYFALVPASRRLDELSKALAEDKPGEVLLRCQERGVLEQIDRELKIDPNLAREIDRRRKALVGKDGKTIEQELLYCLFRRQGQEALGVFLQRMGLGQKGAQRLVDGFLSGN